MAPPSLNKAARTVVWFRNDLRIHDNPLLAAAAAAGEVLPVYCFDPRQFGPARHNALKCSPLRARFLIESVADLRDSLRSIGSDLVVGVGKPEELVPQLVSPGTTVLTSEQVCDEEIQVDAALRRALKPTSSTLQSLWCGTLYEKDALPFRSDLSDMPDVFTPFRNKVESRAQTEAPLAPPRAGSLKLPPSDAVVSSPSLGFDAMPDLAALGFTEEQAAVAPDPRGVLPFRGGESVALQRVRHYIWDADCLGSYFETRNGMLGADYSSKFAPWLALGSLSPRQVKAECESYERTRVKNKSTYWLVFELIWRDFYRFYALKHGNDIFKLLGPARVAQPWVSDPTLLQRWKDGRTGSPLVDANMRELLLTGFMSNRGRQIVASYLALDLKLDWRLGAAHFEQHLLDYDVCSNWGNWAAAAGVTGGRINRFNVVKQAKDYDADGDYVRTWVPELANVPPPKVHEPWQLSRDEQQRYGLNLGVDYPAKPPPSRFGGYAEMGRTPSTADAMGSPRGRGRGGRGGNDGDRPRSARSRPSGDGGKARRASGKGRVQHGAY